MNSILYNSYIELLYKFFSKKVLIYYDWEIYDDCQRCPWSPLKMEIPPSNPRPWLPKILKRHIHKDMREYWLKVYNIQKEIELFHDRYDSLV